MFVQRFLYRTSLQFMDGTPIILSSYKIWSSFADYNVRQGKKTLVDHSSCKCDCIVKASHCTGRQTYSKKNCQCECKTKPQKCPTGKEVYLACLISLNQYPNKYLIYKVQMH